MTSASDRIAALVTNLRKFVGLDEAEYQRVNMHEKIDSTLMLIQNELNTKNLGNKINAMLTLGVPYPEDYAEHALEDLKEQAQQITDGLIAAGIETSSDKEIIALIAYLQRLGTDIMVPDTAGIEDEATESETGSQH